MFEGLFNTAISYGELNAGVIEALVNEDGFLNLFSQLFDSAQNIPTLMQTVGVALLTVLIPFAIAILSNFLRRGEQGKDSAFLMLDLYVILENIFVVRYILMSAFLILIPPFLWDVVPLYRFFIMFVWASGVIWLTTMIYEVYQWRTVQDSTLRFEFLDKIHGMDQLNAAWSSIWVAQNIDNRDERIYLKLFADNLELIVEDNRYHDAALLLEGFRKELSKRFDLSMVVGENPFLRRVLEWRRFTYELEKAVEKEGTSSMSDMEKRLGYIQLKTNIDSILQEMTLNSVLGGHSIWYFNTLEVYFRQYTKDENYIRVIMDVIIPSFLESLRTARSRNKQDLWEGFPSMWKITKESIETKGSYMSRVWFDEYYEWIVPKVYTSETGAGVNVESVTRKLFPNIDPTLFLRAIILANAPYGESKIRSVLENNWDFGFGHLIHPGTKEEQEVYIKNTVELIYSIDILASKLSLPTIEIFKRELIKRLKATSLHEEQVKGRKLMELLDYLLKYGEIKAVKEKKTKRKTVKEAKNVAVS